MKVTKLDLILNAWISLLIGSVLSICLPIIVKGSVSFGEFLMGTAVSGVLGFLIVLFIPIIHWGFAFAAACGAKPRTLKHQLLTTIVLALCIGVFMSAFMNWLGMRGVPDYQKIFLGVWLHALPWALLVIYIMANISLATGVPLAMKLTGQKPMPREEDGKR